MQTTSTTTLVLCRVTVKLFTFRFSRSPIYNVCVGCWRDIALRTLPSASPLLPNLHIGNADAP